MKSPANARTWITDPVESGIAAGFGVYLHVPFCSHRCGYCDFATAAVGGRDDTDALFDAYIEAVVTDLGRQVDAGRRAHLPSTKADASDDHWPTVSSIFIGGGTPTLVGGERLAKVLGAVRGNLDVGAGAEITIECNPETATDELFGALADVGVTRISMGAQSFSPHVLATLERGHSVERPLEAVEQAKRAGIAGVNLDLIFGTPGESDKEWEQTLATVTTAPVDHVSAYALTIHDNTAFGRAVVTGVMPPVNEDVQRDRFEAARQILGGVGFEHYEVSNFALGHHQRSRHNLLYWRHGDYLGVGVGAHAHVDGRRQWTTRSTERYLETVTSGASPVTGSEELTDEERAHERLMLGLRVREGLHPHDVPPIDPLALEEAMNAGLIETACGRVQSTEQGWFLLDDAVSRLI